MGMEIAGIPRGWNKIVRNSRGNVVLFNLYGAPAATKICFEIVEGCLLIFYRNKLYQYQLTDDISSVNNIFFVADEAIFCKLL